MYTQLISIVEAVIMKEAIVHPGDDSVRVEVVDSPIPEPDAGDVLIKVAVSGSNPKDWYVDRPRSICNDI